MKEGGDLTEGEGTGVVGPSEGLQAVSFGMGHQRCRGVKVPVAGAASEGCFMVHHYCLWRPPRWKGKPWPPFKDFKVLTEEDLLTWLSSHAFCLCNNRIAFGDLFWRYSYQQWEAIK